ncbi:hypothetical protein PBY51_008364 [Eleginops maclovinus]|uniref:Uncharacterized protein n=1 Tax=Eleginops maclovinus TaxID=56733 RepID=A0AAN7XA10_ELEMC|nr:hypothetical protein PBY51_008364 [Eleginops maclovinus]
MTAAGVPESCYSARPHKAQTRRQNQNLEAESGLGFLFLSVHLPSSHTRSASFSLWIPGSHLSAWQPS